jgi:hypothetical protein
MVDAWSTPFFYIADDDTHYRFVSAGADGKIDATSRELGPTLTEGQAVNDPNADIIYQDGIFIQYPAGAKPVRKQ